VFVSRREIQIVLSSWRYAIRCNDPARLFASSAINRKDINSDEEC